MTSVKWKERVGGSLVVHIAGAVVEAVPGFVNPSPWPVCPSPDSLSVLTVFLDRHWLGKHWIYWCLQQFCMSDWLFCHWLNHQCWGWQWTFCVAKKEVYVLVTKTPFANFLGWQKSLCGVVNVLKKHGMKQLDWWTLRHDTNQSNRCHCATPDDEAEKFGAMNENNKNARVRAEDADFAGPKCHLGSAVLQPHPFDACHCRAQHRLQTDGNPDVHDQHTKTPKPGKPTLEFEVILSLFSNLTFVNNNIGLLVHNGGLERVAWQLFLAWKVCGSRQLFASTCCICDFHNLSNKMKGTCLQWSSPACMSFFSHRLGPRGKFHAHLFLSWAWQIKCKILCPSFGSQSNTLSFGQISHATQLGFGVWRMTCRLCQTSQSTVPIAPLTSAALLSCCQQAMTVHSFRSMSSIQHPLPAACTEIACPILFDCWHMLQHDPDFCPSKSQFLHHKVELPWHRVQELCALGGSHSTLKFPHQTSNQDCTRPQTQHFCFSLHWLNREHCLAWGSYCQKVQWESWIS